MYIRVIRTFAIRSLFDEHYQQYHSHGDKNTAKRYRHHNERVCANTGDFIYMHIG